MRFNMVQAGDRLFIRIILYVCRFIALIVIIIIQGLIKITALFTVLSLSPSTSVATSTTSTVTSASPTAPAMPMTLRHTLLVRFALVIEKRQPVLVCITCRCTILQWVPVVYYHVNDDASVMGYPSTPRVYEFSSSASRLPNRFMSLFARKSTTRNASQAAFRVRISSSLVGLLASMMVSSLLSCSLTRLASIPSSPPSCCMVVTRVLNSHR